MLLAAVLVVFLLEHDAPKPPGATFLGGDVLVGGGAGDGKDHLIVVGIRAGEVIQVGEGLRPRRMTTAEWVSGCGTSLARSLTSLA